MIRPEWTSYIHALRRREVELIFGACPAKAFPRGLELGAGDGFQSRLLSHYVKSLKVTDYSPEILKQNDSPDITHFVCDAERVDEVFAEEEFDLIFSSNMMEHLPNAGRALQGMYHVLRDDGIAIHIMPSPFWKLNQMAGFFLNGVLRRAEQYVACRKARQGTETRNLGPPAISKDLNPKLEKRQYSYMRRLLWPTPHGVSRSNLNEFVVFHPVYWRSLFASAGFRVVAVRRGPVSSGCGFGFDVLRTLLECAGATSEYVYYAVKIGRKSSHLAYFQ